MLELRPHGISHPRLLLGHERGIGFAELRLSEVVFDEASQTNECPGRIVLPVIGAHAIQAPIVHQVGPLESGLAGNDIGIQHHYRTGRGHKPLRLRRCTIIREDRGPGEDGKTNDRDTKQDPFEHIADRIDAGRRGCDG